MTPEKLPLSIFLFIVGFVFGQNEFITVWKPTDVDVLSPNNQKIFFPGIGTNYTISWEEVGYPQHNGVMNNVTSTENVLITFGAPHNPVISAATYRVKVTNGNGNFHRVKFTTRIYNPVDQTYTVTFHGDTHRITEIQQWGNIVWSSMESAFAQCQKMQLTATDSPNLTQVNDASYMFFNIPLFTGHNSMSNWNTGNIQNFEGMLATDGNGYPATTPGSFNRNLSQLEYEQRN